MWTNGTITPDEALEYATRVLIKHYEFVITGLQKKEIEEEITEESPGKKKEEKKEILSKNVSEFDLSVRSMNCLKAANIKTIGQLVKKTEEDMMQFKNFGKKSLSEIKELLAGMGLTLGMQIDPKKLKKA